MHGKSYFALVYLSCFDSHKTVNGGRWLQMLRLNNNDIDRALITSITQPLCSTFTNTGPQRKMQLLMSVNCFVGSTMSLPSFHPYLIACFHTNCKISAFNNITVCSLKESIFITDVLRSDKWVKIKLKMYYKVNITTCAISSSPGQVNIFSYLHLYMHQF